MPEQIPEAVKAMRATQAKACAAELSQAYRAQFIGRTLEVLFEHPIGQGVWSGHSAYCFPVQASHTAISKIYCSRCLLPGYPRMAYAETSCSDATQYLLKKIPMMRNPFPLHLIG